MLAQRQIVQEILSLLPVRSGTIAINMSVYRISKPQLLPQKRTRTVQARFRFNRRKGRDGRCCRVTKEPNRNRVWTAAEKRNSLGMRHGRHVDSIYLWLTAILIRLQNDSLRFYVR